MRKWKRYLAATFAMILTASTVMTALPQSLSEVRAEDVENAENAVEFVNNTTDWKYLDDNTDPAGEGERTSWTLADFDDSSWKTTADLDVEDIIFGAKNGAIKALGEDGVSYVPTVLLNQYIDGTAFPDVQTYFFRTTFDVASIPEGTELTGTLTYDDAAIVYLNGTKIAAYDEPDGGFESNLCYGGSNAGDPKEVTFTVDTSVLKVGTNVLAVEIHQGRTNSSDIYFAMSSLSLTEAEVEDPTAYTQKSVSLTVGSDETSRNITWYADTATAGTVQYAVKNGEDFPETYQEAAAVSTEANDTGFYSNQATLTDLEYNTEYVYRLINEETVSETYSFKTSGSEAFSFLLVGDPQIGTGNLQTGIDGWEMTLNNALEKFSDAAFLVSAGDQVDAASNETQYAGYLEHNTLKSLTTATVIGNHDSGSDAYNEHFNNPNESTDLGTTSAGGDYWYVYNNVLFMNLNSNDQSNAEHREFMKEAMAANPNVDWKVVVFHHSIYSAASHAYDNDILNRRKELVPIFTELDVDVVLMGHDHVYVRSYMMEGTEPVVTEEVESSVTNPEGILYVTLNSASGSKYYSLKNEAFEYAAVKNQENTPNVSNVEVTENSFKITTYRSSDMSEVDSFEIIRDNDTKTEAAQTQTAGFDNSDASLELTKVAGYDSGIVNADGGSAEIVQYNSDNDMYYVVNGTSGTLDIVPREVYTEENQATGTKFDLKAKLVNVLPDFQYGDMTSVAVNTEKDLIAVAVQAAGTNENGLIVLLNYDNEIVATIDAGVQPDMVTFTADGNKVLSANEGEPRDGYGEGATDPMGSITIADLSAGVDNISAQNVTFEAWDTRRDELTEAGVIIKKNTAPSVDFEPEYIAVNSAGTRAYVALQEANAIATVDLTTNAVTSIKSLGFKDHSLEENALDMLKKDGEINIQTADVYGIYMPDGISIYEVNGTEYLITANEGDSREWGDYCNEVEEKVGESNSKVVFFDTSDYDGVDPEKSYLFGGRSFSIYNAETMEQVYDSGSDFETITAKHLAEYFNCSNDDISMDDRSGKKGPEAESVVIGEVDGKTYAFIGLERIGGVMVYDITDPANAVYVNYINSRVFSENLEDGADISPEGLCFVAAQSSVGQSTPELFVANEVSGTVAIYQLNAKVVDDDDASDEDNAGDEGNTGDQDNSGDQDDSDNQENAGDQDNSDNQENAGDQDDSDNQENTGDQSNTETTDKKDQNSTGVQTGDNVNASLWICLMALAAMSGAGVLIVRKVLDSREK